MTTLTFVQNQNYEGVLGHFTKDDNSDLDISGASEITFRAFTQNREILKFSGTKTNGKVTFLTDGADGKAVYNIQATDLDTADIYQGEMEVILGGKSLKKQNLLLDIKPESPTS